MLVMDLKFGERLRIGEVTVTAERRMDGGGVSFSIDAPSSVRIIRGELEGREPRNNPHQNKAA